MDSQIALIGPRQPGTQSCWQPYLSASFHKVNKTAVLPPCSSALSVSPAHCKQMKATHVLLHIFGMQTKCREGGLVKLQGGTSL